MKIDQRCKFCLISLKFLLHYKIIIDRSKIITSILLIKKNYCMYIYGNNNSKVLKSLSSDTHYKFPSSNTKSKKYLLSNIHPH